MADGKELIYSKGVLEMLTVANEFCLFIEDIKSQSRENAITYLQKVFPLLYLKGSLLPDVLVSDSEANERFVTEEHWENIFNAVKEKMDKQNDFWFIPFPSDSIPHPAKGTIAEHIADIYQDMKDFIVLYQKAGVSAKENAVSECKRLFQTNWGTRVLETTKTFHQLLNPEGKEEADREENPFNF